MISVCDMFSIGIGPSSSHTVGPMRAAFTFASELENHPEGALVDTIQCELFGSLAHTGRGHGTHRAIMLGLLGNVPEKIDVETIEQALAQVSDAGQLSLLGRRNIAFSEKKHILFNRKKLLPPHNNAMRFSASREGVVVLKSVYYSIGGGFIVSAADERLNTGAQSRTMPWPFTTAKELLTHCREHGLSIGAIMEANEIALDPTQAFRQHIDAVWDVMVKCIKRGCKTEGCLPGGLKVKRRAPGLYKRLKSDQTNDPLIVMDWVNLYALAVNEENAAGGKVVTAPTNGAAGILPAVLMYYNWFVREVDSDILQEYFLTATAIGSLYKHNASISGAEVGCQGEVGVACSMAAGALAAIMGGTPEAVENAAEIGMEHNLGLTCDPIGGLVQVPCIERNAMGATKAINAARLALRGSGEHKVSLDRVIATMRATGKDMKSKYKETSRGGLAVNVPEC
jgi:L-serine dehydratase